MESHPFIKLIQNLSSAHIAFVKIITEMYFKSHPLKKIAYLKRYRAL